MNPTHHQHEQNQTNLINHHHAKRDISCPPPLKINRDSHFIKKSSSSPSTSSLINGVAGPAKPPHQQRHPVIIYTHSPKVIHTHPRDFMALVQKLTGLSRSEDSPVALGPDNNNNNVNNNNNNNNPSVGISDDNDSSSVITDENCSSGSGDSSSTCFVPPMFEGNNNNNSSSSSNNNNNSYMANIPVFTPNSADFLCPNNQTFYNYTDSLFFNPNMATRSSISPSSTLDGIAEFRDF